MTHRRVIALAIAAGVAFAPAGSVLAKSGVNVGVLKCTVDGGIGMILGSSKTMKCSFAPAGGGPEQFYTGKVNKVGLDIGVTEKSHITWVVFAPGKVNHGALAGVYIGATADAAIGVGIGCGTARRGFQLERDVNGEDQLVDRHRSVATAVAGASGATGRRRGRGRAGGRRSR